MLVPPNTVEALAYISDPGVRKAALVPDDNKFLFANTGK